MIFEGKTKKKKKGTGWSYLQVKNDCGDMSINNAIFNTNMTPVASPDGGMGEMSCGGMGESLHNIDDTIYYHGSGNKFDKFSRTKIDLTNGDIPGFWFTTDKDKAYQYGDYLHKVRLNITKPISFTDLTINAEQLSKLTGYSVNQCSNALSHFDNDYELINSTVERNNYTSFYEYLYILKDVTGYDGYIWKDTAVVFFEDQIIPVSDDTIILTENEQRGDLSYYNNFVSSYDQQSDYSVNAMKDDDVVGYLDYSVYEGIPYIQMIEVVPEFRRQGVATKMLQYLQALFPGVEIQTGYTTTDGTALFAKAMEKRPNTMGKKYQATYKRLLNRKSTLERQLQLEQSQLDAFYDTPVEDISDEYRKEILEVGDSWNTTYSDLQEINFKLQDLQQRYPTQIKPTINIVKGAF